MTVHEKISVKFNAQKNRNYIHDGESGQVIIQNIFIDFATSVVYFEPTDGICYKQKLDLSFNSLAEFMEKL